MGTIRSTSENITFNADGSGNDIIFQSNGVQIGSLSDSGVFTATSFAGSGSALTNAGASSISGVTDFTVSASDPATDSNPSAVGHLWVNKTSGEVFVSTDVTTDSNVWTNTGAGSGDVAPLPVWYGDRGVFGGSYISGTVSTTIDYIDISTLGNGTDFGDLTVGRHQLTACSSGSRGVFIGGQEPGVYSDVMDYITISTTGNATDFGNMVIGANGPTACSSTTRGVIVGGTTSSATATDRVDYITIASTGNATSYGTLAYVTYYSGSVSNGTRAHIIGGHGLSSRIDPITYFTIDSDLAAAEFNFKCAGDATRGVFGRNPTLYYITYASTSNAVTFGSIGPGAYSGATGNSTRGVWSGANSVTIEYITIQTTGNSVDFGDLTTARQGIAGTSGD